ncbi:MAG: PqiC family protein [Nitrospirota bacterium]|nr:PqiC family protein [Nitrospirota bacterium]MDH5587186.1 PqiC family protein [Nitrospirota bacterium]MDH5776466.1 PqiC family protein [Nitrospirota bacterium]
MRHIVGCGLVIMLLSFSGCANTQPTHFYLLRAMETNDSFAMEVAKNSALSLGVGPISLPKYLDRPHIVTRISAHEINLAEFHKWGAPLKDNLSNVLLENLSRLLSTNQIVKYPWNRSHLPDYQLSLEVTQFDGAKNQEATLRVRWRLAADDGKRVLEEKTSQFSEVIRGSGYEDLVEAMSRMLATFSQEIADVLNRPPRLL